MSKKLNRVHNKAMRTLALFVALTVTAIMAIFAMSDYGEGGIAPAYGYDYALPHEYAGYDYGHNDSYCNGGEIYTAPSYYYYENDEYLSGISYLTDCSEYPEADYLNAYQYTHEGGYIGEHATYDYEGNPLYEDGGYIGYAPGYYGYFHTPNDTIGYLHRFSFLNADDYLYLTNRMGLYQAEELFELLVILSRLNRDALRALDCAEDFAAMLLYAISDEWVYQRLQALTPQYEGAALRVSLVYKEGVFERVKMLDTLVRHLDPGDSFEYIGIVAFGGNEIIINPYLRINTQIALTNAIATASTTVGVFTTITITGNFTLTAAVPVDGGRQVHIQGNVAGPAVGDTTGDTSNAGQFNAAFRYLHQNIAARHFNVTGANTHLRLQNIVLASTLAHTSTQNRGGVAVSAGGAFTMMAGSEVRNARWPNGGGVHIANIATFTLSGGLIRWNVAHNATGADHTGRGGGVLVTANPPAPVGRNALMVMNSGRISHNVASTTGGVNSGWGGGVNVEWFSEFNFHGGTISHNTAIPHTVAATRNSSGLGGGVMAAAGTRGDNAAGHTFVMWETSNPIIENNTAHRGGGLSMHHGAAAVTRTILRGGEIRSNTAGEFGGGIYVQGGQVVTHLSSVIHNNTAGIRGGGIYSNGTVTFTLGHIRNNRVLDTGATANSGGGGVYVAAGTFTFGGSATIGGEAIGNANRAFRGAGVYVLGGTFTMDGGNIRNNLAIAGGAAGNVPTGTGGGVYIAGGTFTFGNTTTAKNINHNLAVNGGGINRSAAGALLNFGTGTGLININNNEARNGNGGGMLINGTANITMGNNAINIFGNTAINGGGIFKTGPATITMTGGTIGGTTVARRNEASQMGGGVYINQGGFTMTAGTINGNHVSNIAANEGGGGVRVTGGTFTLGGTGAIAGNTAGPIGGGSAAGGGGVNISGAASTFFMDGGSITGNSAVHGGGVLVHGGANFTMRGTAQKLIAYNSADRNHASSARGGGVYLLGGNFTMVAGGVIRNNTQYSVDAGTQPGGGGVFMAGASVFTMHAGSINDNTARWSGGGIRMMNTSQFFMYSGSISGNTTRAAGGGIVVGDGTTLFEMRGSAAKNITNNRAGGSGGGLHLQAGSTVTATEGANINNNRAGTTGGGVNMIGGTFHMMHPTININQNTAGTTGGGVHITGASTAFNMHGGSISGNGHPAQGINTAGATINVATTQGGGVHIMGGFFTLTGSGTKNINNNRATQNGGGINWISGQWNTAANAGPVNINDNHALINGGGVSMTTGALTIVNNWTIRGNEAGNNGGGVFGNNVTLIMTGGVIGGAPPVWPPDGTPNPHANTAINGAGIWAENGTSLTMSPGSATISGTIIGNIAAGTGVPTGLGGGVHVTGSGSGFYMSAGSITQNIAVNYNYQSSSGNGGGIWLGVNATGEISGGSITRNLAERSGAGIEVQSGAIFDMTNGTISDNIAGWGNGAGVHVPSAGAFNMYNGIISGNRALGAEGVNIGHGGGVHANSAGSTFTMRGGIISGNQAGRGGGVSSTNGNSFNFYGGIIGGIRGQEDGSGNPIINTNTATYYGGGVFVGANANFNLRGNSDKRITGNDANYGGGVWVNLTGTMTVDSAAANTYITDNRANRMGGGIYSEDNCYNDPLIRVTAGDMAYGNLTITNAVTFTGNRANRRYVPPTNYAVLTHINFAGTATSQPAHSRRIHPLNNYDINFRLDGYDFEFYKTNHLLYSDPRQVQLLQGAYFRVFRTDMDPTLANLPITALGLITFDSQGDPSFPWEEVPMFDGIHVSPGEFVLNDPLGFEMIPGFTYQLVEVMSPPGFQIPVGQWRMWQGNPLDNTAISFQGIGNVAPLEFVRNGPSLRPDIPANWFVGNMPDFSLPLTGGAGTNTMTLAVTGGAMVGVGIVAVFAITTKKKLEMKSNI